MSEDYIADVPGPLHWLPVRLVDVVRYGQAESVEPADIPQDSWVVELEDIESKSGRLLRRVSAVERAPRSSKFKFSAGDVLYGRLRPKLSKVLLAPEGGYCSTEIVPLRPHPEILPKYLAYWLRGTTFGAYAH